jgi:hypothetical protein
LAVSDGSVVYMQPLIDDVSLIIRDTAHFDDQMAAVALNSE